MGILDDAHRDGVVIGLSSESDVPVARLDIDVMLLDQPDTFNLMIIALLEIMGVENLPWDTPNEDKVTNQDKFSWFQICGIHGLPLKPWDGIEPPDLPKDSSDPTGRKKYSYCRHATPAFESWHRPYLAMLEQALYRQVAKVAVRFGNSDSLTREQKEQYQKAAKQFRLPYVDYFRPRNYRRMIPGIPDYDDPYGWSKGDKAAGPYPHWRGTNKMITVPYDNSLPQIITLPKIIVKTLPNNESKLVQNPFFSFKLPHDFLDADEWTQANLDLTIPEMKDFTMRYGSNKPKSVTQMNDTLCKLREDQLRMTLTLLNHNGPYTRFGAVTTNGADGIPKEFTRKMGLSQSPMGSLESVHNDYHVYYGGFVGTRMWKPSFDDPNPPEWFGKPNTWAGHMTSVPVAAFDPVFWIHHVEVDRLFAIWQAANPETWFEDLPTKDLQDLGQAELYPFRKSKKTEKETLWTSDDVRDWKVFGYTYPDFETGDQTPDGIRKQFSYLYAWGARPKPGIVLGVHQKPPPEMEPLDVSNAQVFQFERGSTEEYIFEKLGPKHDAEKYAEALGLSSLEISEEIQNQPSYAWYIDDAVERLCQNGSFTIFYIIDMDGVVGSTGDDWVKQPGFVGLTHIFTGPTEACSGCAQQQAEKKIVTSTTPITSLLLDYVETGKLKSMTPEDVGPFLVKYLKWRIQTVEGKVIDPREMSKANQLRITISHTETAPSSDGVLWMGGAQPTGVNHIDIIKEIIKNADTKTS